MHSVLRRLHISPRLLKFTSEAVEKNTALNRANKGKSSAIKPIRHHPNAPRQQKAEAEQLCDEKTSLGEGEKTEEFFEKLMQSMKLSFEPNSPPPAVHEEQEPARKASMIEEKNAEGKLSQAVKAFQSIESPDADCYNSLLKSFVSGNNMAGAKHVFNRMRFKKIDMKSETIAIMMQGFAMNKSFDDAFALIEECKKLKVLDESCYTPLLFVCGKDGLVEMAYKLYNQMSELGVKSGPDSLISLIHACSKRKDFYNEGFLLLEKLEKIHQDIPIAVYNTLLYACAKNSDLKTGMIIWKKLNECKEQNKLTLNQVSFANIMWLLASVETSETKISEKNFVYDLKPSDILQKITEIKNSITIPWNAYMLNAYLAAISNQLCVAESENVFYEQFSNLALIPTPHSAEILLKLYDTCMQKNKQFTLKKLNEKEYTDMGREIGSIRRVFYEKSKKLEEFCNQNHISLTYSSMRSLIRIASFNDDMDYARAVFKKMLKSVPKIQFSQMKLFYTKAIENERHDIAQEIATVCVADMKKPRFSEWKERTFLIDRLLDNVYGKEKGRGYHRGKFGK